MHFMDEKLTKSTLTEPTFGTCCLEGRIVLPNLRVPPEEFIKLLEGTDEVATSFRENIRRYNTSNTFTSLGCTLKPRKLKGTGPQLFSIHGQLRHRTGTLLPENPQSGTYSQLYIYDPKDAVSKRLELNPRLNITVLEIIQQVMSANNPFVKKYSEAFELLKSNERRCNDIHVSLQYEKGSDPRRCNLPTAD